ncbi:hypothetical protein F5Y08DRAFT_335982 [Xylaria arbuscula]|nr:hypothetical protein F5Y08DRAFT_335982 [Xylaria arbuscula]
MATLGPNAEGKNVWSGMAVKWATLDTPYTTYTPSEVTEILPIPVTRKKLRPNFGKVRHFWPDDEYGDGNRFAILGIRGVLIPVSIHQKFEGRADTLVAAKLTDHRSDFGRNMWRRVTTPQGGQTVAGWASVEHPDYQTDDECRASGDVLGLVIKTITGIIAGFGMGNLKDKMTAYKVLYIRPVRVHGFEDSFERIGTGRLFGDVIDSQFHNTEKKDIWLV